MIPDGRADDFSFLPQLKLNGTLVNDGKAYFCPSGQTETVSKKVK